MSNFYNFMGDLLPLLMLLVGFVMGLWVGGVLGSKSVKGMGE